MRYNKKKVSKVGMGCFGIGGAFGEPGNWFAYGDVDDEESIRTIHKAIEKGVTIFDTADVYGHGRSERVLGRAIKEYRDDVIIATKFASRFVDGKPLEKPKEKGKGTSEKYIRSAIDASMERLQTDFIEIYQLHASSLEIEEALNVRNVLEDLVAEGRIGGYGWSTDNVESFSEYAKGHNCIAVQYARTLIHRNPSMQKLCSKEGLYGLIRSPLGSGTMTPKYAKGHKVGDNHMLAKIDFDSEKRIAINDKLSQFDMIAAENDYSRVQGILLYLMGLGNTVIPIPGAKTVGQIEENASVLDLKLFTEDQMSRIDTVFNDIAVYTFKGIAE